MLFITGRRNKNSTPLCEIVVYNCLYKQRYLLMLSVRNEVVVVVVVVVVVAVVVVDVVCSRSKYRSRC